MPETTPEIQPKESRIQKFGPPIFWGTMLAMPAINLAAAYFGYKDTKLQLELARCLDATEK